MCKSQRNKFLLNVFLLSIFLVLTGCAGQNVVENPDTVKVDISEKDPYENFNRKVFGFNEDLDTYLAKPVSDAYLYVTPQLVQTGIANFFNNLKDINVMLNNVMQGKLKEGAEDTGRFAINTTIGLAGLFDVATEIGLEKHDEDFAQTLAVWGVPQGPYLILPILGPSSGRGVPGSLFDTAANPASYVGAPVQLIQLLNARANADGSLNLIEEAALDPYVFTRESFLQNRKFLITDGKSEITDDFSDLEDEFYDEDEELTVEVSQDIISTDNSNIKSVSGVNKNTNDSSFNQASDSFDSATKSFDNATDSFEAASDKLNQLQHQ